MRERFIQITVLAVSASGLEKVEAEYEVSDKSFSRPNTCYDLF